MDLYLNITSKIFFLCSACKSSKASTLLVHCCPPCILPFQINQGNVVWLVIFFFNNLEFCHTIETHNILFPILFAPLHSMEKIHVLKFSFDKLQGVYSVLSQPMYCPIILSVSPWIRHPISSLAYSIPFHWCQLICHSESDLYLPLA
jgi:hypothetical protein